MLGTDDQPVLIVDTEGKEQVFIALDSLSKMNAS